MADLRSPIERLGNKVTSTFIEVGTAILQFMVDVMTWPFYQALNLIGNALDDSMNIGSYPGQNASTSMGMHQGVWTAINQDIQRTTGLSKFFIAVMFTSAAISSYMGAIFATAGRSIEQRVNMMIQNRLVSADEAVIAAKRGLLSYVQRDSIGSTEGYTTEQLNIKESLTLVNPDVNTLRELFLRGKMSRSEVLRQLGFLGFNFQHAEGIMQLFDLIPPINDLITMSVREVFTPEVAERFGQFEDFPPDFAQHAATKGLSNQWALNYWAAHWRLPSFSQANEMLHRGIIDTTDYNLLLKSLDIMPFWREKLKQMSFRTFTRVDTRRMYKQGILNYDQVLKSYKDIGYSPEKAGQLADFTVADNIDSDAELTKTDVLNGYKRRLLSESQTRHFLGLMGFDTQAVNFFIARIDSELETAKKKELLSGLKAKFVAGVITENQARTRMSQANLPSSEIEELMELWTISKEAKVLAPSLGDLTRFLRQGIISSARFETELKDSGASPEHIDWYIRSIKFEPGAEIEVDLTRADILSGYREGLFSENQAKNRLGALGFDSESVDFYITREKDRLAADLRDAEEKAAAIEAKAAARIAAVELKNEIARLKFKYISRATTEPEARLVLESLKLGSAEVDELLVLWTIARDKTILSPSLSNLKTLFAQEIIARDIFIKELKDQGATDEHIGWWLQQIEGVSEV